MRKAPGGDAYWTYVSLPGTQRIRFRFPLKRGFSSARRPEAMRAVRAFGLLEYVSLWRTQRTRFRNSLLAALLYKIKELGLSMHTDLHIDMSDVGLRRIE